MSLEAPKGNGCGPSWLPGWAWPDFSFTKECQEHDEAYGRGGDTRSRFSSDSVFYVHMSETVEKEKNIWKRLGLGIVAPVNHLLVRVGGWASYKYRKVSRPPQGGK